MFSVYRSEPSSANARSWIASGRRSRRPAARAGLEVVLDDVEPGEAVEHRPGRQAVRVVVVPERRRVLDVRVRVVERRARRDQVHRVAVGPGRRDPAVQVHVLREGQRVGLAHDRGAALADADRRPGVDPVVAVDRRQGAGDDLRAALLDRDRVVVLGRGAAHGDQRGGIRRSVWNGAAARGGGAPGGRARQRRGARQRADQGDRAHAAADRLAPRDPRIERGRASHGPSPPRSRSPTGCRRRRPRRSRTGTCRAAAPARASTSPPRPGRAASTRRPRWRSGP